MSPQMQENLDHFKHLIRELREVVSIIEARPSSEGNELAVYLARQDLKFFELVVERLERMKDE